MRMVVNDTAANNAFTMNGFLAEVPTPDQVDPFASLAGVDAPKAFGPF